MDGLKSKCTIPPATDVGIDRLDFQTYTDARVYSVSRTLLHQGVSILLYTFWLTYISRQIDPKQGDRDDAQEITAF